MQGQDFLVPFGAGHPGDCQGLAQQGETSASYRHDKRQPPTKSKTNQLGGQDCSHKPYIRRNHPQHIPSQRYAAAPAHNEPEPMRLIHTSDWHLGQTLHGQDRDYEHAQFLAGCSTSWSPTAPTPCS